MDDFNKAIEVHGDYSRCDENGDYKFSGGIVYYTSSSVGDKTPLPHVSQQQPKIQYEQSTQLSQIWMESNDHQIHQEHAYKSNILKQSLIQHQQQSGETVFTPMDDFISLMHKPPVQIICLNARKSQQIMNSEQFEYTYNKFKNKKNLISHQSNESMEYSNIYKLSALDNQTDGMHTVNHQITSGSPMKRKRQGNDFYLPQLLPHQQMTCKIINPGLLSNMKTISNNTSVNDQQVLQTRNILRKQSAVTEQEYQKNTKSMYTIKLVQLHQKQNSLKQLKSELLKINDTTEQQFIFNQPITKITESDVVQSLGVPTVVQNSTTQPQQTVTISTNNETETQSPSQENLTDEKRFNVNINAASNHAKSYKLTTSNFNQLVTKRVAAVLEKSAIKQTISHQNLSQSSLLGSNIKLSPDKCLLGCVFLIIEYDQCSVTSNDVASWKQIIHEHCGEVEQFYTSSVTHILCKTQKHPLVQKGLHEGKRCITAYWLSDVMIKKQLMPPWYALHFPTQYDETKPCKHMLISLTNFEDEERKRVKFMIELTGAQVTSYFSAQNNILVAKKLEGNKVEKALHNNCPVVNVQWLNDVLFGNLQCILWPKNYVYQQFNLKNPFNVDYKLVFHLMKAWESPIIITRETFYRKSNNNLVSNNPKLPKSNSQDLINQDNSDLSTTDVIITNLISKDYLPCIMLTGFGLALKEQRMVLQLGGTIATNYSDTTHLVMKEPVRTTKFLACISTVKHILTEEWLKDSFTQHMFLNESVYTVEEVSVDQTVHCNVRKTLSNPNRHKLFKGKIFYVTPGVICPSTFVVRQIIESAGGSVDKQRRSLKAIQEFEPNTYIVITIDNDFHLVADLIQSSYNSIYSTEFVLSAVMTQYIDYEKDVEHNKSMIT